jgi:hypothetical protein
VRITRNASQVSIRDQAAPFWLLGLFLLAGGVLAVAMPLGLATNAGNSRRGSALPVWGWGSV